MVITDDFGQRIQMSLDQLADLVADVRRGVLDEVLARADDFRPAVLSFPTRLTVTRPAVEGQESASWRRSNRWTR